MKPALRKDLLARSGSLMALLYAIADLIAIASAAVLAHYLALGDWNVSEIYRIAAVLCLSLTLTVFSWFGLYASWRGRSYEDQASNASLAWLTVLVILILLGFFLGVIEAFSRTWLAWLSLCGWIFVVAVRVSVMMVLRELRNHGLNHKRVIIAGGGEWGTQIIRRLFQAAWLGMDVVAVVDHDPGLHGTSVEGLPIRGDYDLLPELIEKERANEVWICLPMQSPRSGVDQIERIRSILEHNTVTQRLVPKIAEFRLMNKPITEIMGMPVVNLSTSPMHGVNRLVKELEDRLLAIIILAVVSPLMLLIAMLIKLTSGGPVLFKQHRHGWDGKPIRVYKFRTMKMHREGNGRVTQARRSDARVTPIGRFLRRTSLDELPQFVNVLQGRMSIVGPRPHAIEHNQFYMEQIDSYMQRHKVKPGISGWAQVNGLRGETDTLEKMKKRVQYDMYYIDNWSFWFDIKIIALTMWRGFVHPNAY